PSDLDMFAEEVAAVAATLDEAERRGEWPATPGVECGFCELACPVADQQMLFGFPAPFESALAQGGILVVMAVLAYGVGRWRGGRGSFADALILMVWWQAVLLGFQLVQIAALLLFPVATNLLGLAGLVLVFWLLTGFIAELHGFSSPGLVLVGIIATLVAAAILASLLLMPFMSAGMGVSGV
ncbi:MAG: YIP1 family protein, partial [Pseudomonadota bacterium]